MATVSSNAPPSPGAADGQSFTTRAPEGLAMALRALNRTWLLGGDVTNHAVDVGTSSIG